MKDMLKILLQAKEQRPSLKESDFIKILRQVLASDPSLTLDWDDGAGEEWARFFHPTVGITCMISTKLRLAFVRKAYDFGKIQAALENEEVVFTDDYSSEDWSIDLDRLRNDVPEIFWHTSADAVDASCFSLDDFYFATI